MSVYEMLELKVGDQVRHLGATSKWTVTEVGDWEVYVTTPLGGGLKTRIGPRECGNWALSPRPPRRAGEA